MRIKTVIVNDKMQQKYVYTLTKSAGKNFDPRFKPELTPKEMLELGVFGETDVIIWADGTKMMINKLNGG